MNFKLSPESNLYRPLGSQVNSTDIPFLKIFSFYRKCLRSASPEADPETGFL